MTAPSGWWARPERHPPAIRRSLLDAGSIRFAGIAVDDYGKALEWYRRLLGAEPSFYPNDVEAVWQLAEDRFVYIIVDPRRAGGAVNMIWFDDPAATVAAIEARGVTPTEIEKHDPVWKYVFHDPDGNEIGIGGTISGTD